MSDSCKSSPDMMIDTGISSAVSPTFRSSLAMAPLPAPLTSRPKDSMKQKGFTTINE